MVSLDGRVDSFSKRKMAPEQRLSIARSQRLEAFRTVVAYVALSCFTERTLRLPAKPCSELATVIRKNLPRDDYSASLPSEAYDAFARVLLEDGILTPELPVIAKRMEAFAYELKRVDGLNQEERVKVAQTILELNSYLAN